MLRKNILVMVYDMESHIVKPDLAHCVCIQRCISYHSITSLTDQNVVYKQTSGCARIYIYPYY